jgi:hypothetical protein
VLEREEFAPVADLHLQRVSWRNTADASIDDGWRRISDARVPGRITGKPDII